jgi:hypothetical protein
MDRRESRMPISLLLILTDALQATLENHVAAFEEWLKLWTAIVVLGLLYEYGCELLEPPRNWPPKRPWPFRHSVQLVKLGAVFVTVGVAGELYVEVMASPAQEALRKFNDTRLAELNKEAGDARKKSGDLERDNLLLQADVLKLRQRMADRRLSPEQQLRIGEDLCRFAGIYVEIGLYNSDGEMQTLGEDLRGALPDKCDGEAGFVVSVTQKTATIGFSGIEVVIKDGTTEKSRSFAGVLASALRNEGRFQVKGPTPEPKRGLVTSGGSAFRRSVGNGIEQGVPVEIAIGKKP